MTHATTIENVNGLRRFELNLGTEGGVLLLLGPNGAGKTSAINAVRAALGDQGARAEPSDGTEKGIVIMDGVTLKVGKQRRTDGSPALQLLDHSPISQLIEPGIVDRERAAQARLKALLQLVPIDATPLLQLGLCGEDEALARALPASFAARGMSLIELADEVRKLAQSHARAAESARDQALGRQASAAARAQAIGPVPSVALDGKYADEVAAKATIAAARSKLEREARVRLEAQQAEVRGTLGEEPDMAAADAEFAASEREVDDLRGKLAAAQARREQKLHERGRVVREWGHWKAAADILAKPVEGPTEDECAAAQKAADDATLAAKMAQHAAAATAARAEEATASNDAQAAAARANRMREVAAKLPEKLAAAIAKAGVPGLTIIDGRLHVVEGDKTRDFADRLSFGERVRVALGIALRASPQQQGAPTLLALDPAFWGALDPAHKREVHEIAKAMTVQVLTEEPSEGELRVEAMNGGAT